MFKTLKQSLFKYRQHFIQNKQCLLLCFCIGSYTLDFGFHRSWPAVAMALDFPQMWSSIASSTEPLCQAVISFHSWPDPFSSPLYLNIPIHPLLLLCLSAWPCQDSLWERSHAMCGLKVNKQTDE